MFWCDNRCSDKALRFWQFAPVVIDDVVESYTVNLCLQCYNERLMSWQWKAVVDKKAHRGKVWQMLGKDQFIQGPWAYFSLARAKAKKFLKDAEKERQEWTQGQWQQESSAKEFLEQVKSSADTDCTPKMMKHGFFCVEKWRVWRNTKASSRLK